MAFLGAPTDSPTSDMHHFLDSIASQGFGTKTCIPSKIIDELNHVHEHISINAVADYHLLANHYRFLYTS